MAKQRYINTKFWSDPWVVDNLNPLDRYLFMYLLTNDKTNVAGIYEISIRTIAFETGLDNKEIARMLERLEPKIHYIDGWIVIRKAIKHQNFKNGLIRKGILEALKNAPTSVISYIDLPRDIVESYKSLVDPLHLDLDINLNSNHDAAKLADDEEGDMPVNTRSVGKKPHGNAEVQSIITKRRELKWVTPFGGSSKEPYYAKQLLMLDDYKTIIDVMQSYEKRRHEPYMIGVSSLDSLYKRYPEIKSKVLLDSNIPPDVLSEITKYCREAADQSDVDDKEAEYNRLLEVKKNRYIKEGGVWR